MLWFGHQKEAFFQASRSEQVDTIERLIEYTTLRSGYYLLLVLAALIVTPGLFLDNISIVIGGMILAPLLLPLLTLALSLVTGNVHGILRSLGILLMSVLLTIGVAVIETLILSQAYDRISFPQEIDAGVYVFIAFCSGLAGAFAWVKKDLAPAIAGVATAVSLLPPLCVTGIGIALFDLSLVKNSLIIFTANLLGITFAAFLVFWILGFLKFGDVQQKVIEKSSD